MSDRLINHALFLAAALFATILVLVPTLSAAQPLIA